MKIQTLIIFILLLFISLEVTSQSIDYSGPVSSSMAFAKVFDDSPWATLSNTANLAYYEELSVGAAYQLRYHMEELSAKAATVLMPTRYGTFSALIFQSGYSKSNYSKYGFSYSRLFGARVAAGLQFNYLTHQMANADLVDGFYSSIGLTIQANSSVALGIFIQNPEQANLIYSEMEYAIPSFFNTAIRWSATHHFTFVAEFEKDMEYDPVYKSAIQFNFKDKLFVRGGFKGKPVEFTFGGGFHFYGLGIDVGFSHHQQLGLTSGAGITYLFGSKKVQE